MPFDALNADVKLARLCGLMRHRLYLAWPNEGGGNHGKTSPGMSLSVIIVEDQIWQRNYISQVCRERLGLEVLGETGDGAEAIRLIEQQRPELALIDLYLHADGPHGFTVAETIMRTRPQVKCLFMSVCASPVVLERVERMHAWGFIDKNLREPDLLERALGAVLEGRRYFSPSYQECLKRRRYNPHACDKLLTNREREVLRWVGLARSDEEIADALAIDVRTAQDHRLRVMRKLNKDTTLKLMQFAIAEGLTEFADDASRPQILA